MGNYSVWFQGLATCVGVLGLTILYGVLVAIGLSVAELLVRVARPGMNDHGAKAGELPRQLTVRGGSAALPRQAPRRYRLPGQSVTSAGRSIRLHELLARPGVHVLLDRGADLPGTLPLGPLIRLHHITSNPGHGLLTVRPDGYVGLRCRIAEPRPAQRLAQPAKGARDQQLTRRTA